MITHYHVDLRFTMFHGCTKHVPKLLSGDILRFSANYFVIKG